MGTRRVHKSFIQKRPTVKEVGVMVSKAAHLTGVAALAIAVALAVMAPATAQPGTTTPKGSSCAHPYQVHWNPDVASHFVGDTLYVRAKFKLQPIPLGNHPPPGVFLLSYVPRTPGLRACTFKFIMDYGKPGPHGSLLDTGQVAVEVLWHSFHRTPVAITVPNGRPSFLKTVVASARWGRQR
jgi:hypothetical protein